MRRKVMRRLLCTLPLRARRIVQNTLVWCKYDSIDKRSCESPLFAACKYSGDPSTVRFLIANGADVDVQCGIKTKLTPLMAVLTQGGKKVTALASQLVNAGANPHQQVGPRRLHPIDFLTRSLSGMEDPVMYSLVFLLSTGVHLPSNFSGRFSVLDKNIVVKELKDLHMIDSNVMSFMNTLVADCPAHRHVHGHDNCIRRCRHGQCHSAILEAWACDCTEHCAPRTLGFLARAELLLHYVYINWM